MTKSRGNKSGLIRGWEMCLFFLFSLHFSPRVSKDLHPPILMHTHTHTHTPHIHQWTLKHTHTQMNTQTHTHTHTCAHTSLYTCVFISRPTYTREQRCLLCI